MRGSKEKWPSTLFTRSAMVSAIRFGWVRKRSRRVRSQVFRFLVTHLFTNRFGQLELGAFRFHGRSLSHFIASIAASNSSHDARAWLLRWSDRLASWRCRAAGSFSLPLPAWPLSLASSSLASSSLASSSSGLFQLGLFSLGHLGPVPFNDQPSAARFVRDIRAHRLLISLSCPLSKGKRPRLMHRFFSRLLNRPQPPSASAFATTCASRRREYRTRLRRFRECNLT